MRGLRTTIYVDRNKTTDRTYLVAKRRLKSQPIAEQEVGVAERRRILRPKQNCLVAVFLAQDGLEFWSLVGSFSLPSPHDQGKREPR